jgi:hypothetical protein
MTTSPAKLAANKRWADGNKERVKAYKMAYYNRNRDLVNEKNKIRNKITYARKKEEKRVAIQAETDLRANTIANIPIEVFAELLVGLNITPEIISSIQSDLVAGVKIGLSADKLAKSHAILITQ